jgi:hypothetical protein
MVLDSTYPRLLHAPAVGKSFHWIATAKLLQVVELCNTLLEFLTLPLTLLEGGVGRGSYLV